MDFDRSLPLYIDMTDSWLYCEKCGKKLIPHHNQMKVGRYDGGKPVYVAKLVCPKMTFWNFHDVVHIIMNSNTGRVERY